MTTAPVKSLIDEQLEDISAHNLREAYSLAERRGQFFTRNGILVASTAQEGLIRVVDDSAAAAAVPAKE